MPTPIKVGTEIKEINFLEALPPDEGEINFIYGRIGAGKTYCGTSDILEDLKRGQIWYVNWKIKFDGYDERSSKWRLFLGILGLKKQFYYFPETNLHYMNITDPNNVWVDNKATGLDFVSWIATITDAKMAFDEAHIVWDSYQTIKIDPRLKNAALWTRHFDRSYLLISQRPTNIHVQLRANVNRFYKCEKTSDFKIFGKRWQRFLKTEFQDTDNYDRPDETKIKKLNEDTHMLEDTNKYQFAVSEKRYFGKKKIFEAYDTKYRREGLATSQPNYAQLYQLRWIERIRTFVSRRARKQKVKVMEVPKPNHEYEKQVFARLNDNEL